MTFSSIKQIVRQRQAMVFALLLLMMGSIGNISEQSISEHSIAPSASESPVNWDLRERLSPVISIKRSNYRDRQASDVLATPSKQYG